MENFAEKLKPFVKCTNIQQRRSLSDLSLPTLAKSIKKNYICWFKGETAFDA